MERDGVEVTQLLSLDFTKLSTEVLVQLFKRVNKALGNNRYENPHSKLNKWKAKNKERTVKYFLKGSKQEGRHGDLLVQDEYGRSQTFTIDTAYSAPFQSAQRLLAAMALRYINNLTEPRESVPEISESQPKSIAEDDAEYTVASNLDYGEKKDLKPPVPDPVDDDDWDIEPETAIPVPDLKASGLVGDTSW